MATEEPQVGGIFVESTEQGKYKEPDFKEYCFAIREQIETLKLDINVLKRHSVFIKGQPIGSPMDFDEMKANLQLAYRHLEDARMRLGKAVQAYDGGQSCYPK